jgi:K+-sensing histidine kinase KdpD
MQQSVRGIILNNITMNNDKKLITFFDTPERDSYEKVASDSESMAYENTILQIIEGFPDLALILNESRQIVYWNSKALDIFNVKEGKDILGKRFGEAFNCIHHNEMEAGCGTSRFCSECGAAKAIKNSREKKVRSEEECRITTSVDEKETSFEFSVYSTPFIFKNKPYLIFAVKDISDEKRRQALEKIFFHDVLNTAGAVNGLVSLLPMVSNDSEKEEILKALTDSSQQLLNEIVTQRELKNAETGNLSVTFEIIKINEILDRSRKIYVKHDLAKNKVLNVEFCDDNLGINTDSSLLVRSLSNLIKNALEATPENGTVKLYTEVSDDYVSFNVFNEAVIPEAVKLQIFQRSFSTKSNTGRGIGLYSVKLIVEQYLNGYVFFRSNEKDKTVFTIKVPKTEQH